MKPWWADWVCEVSDAGGRREEREGGIGMIYSRRGGGGESHRLVVQYCKPL